MITYRVGVDIGGTFTDIVLLGDDGSIHTKKISSSVDDYARAIVQGLAELFRETNLDGTAIEEIRHGTTVASNAILEQKGARVGLITTKGFRDILEIRTLRMPRLYDMGWTKPVPLVERYLRRVVDERIDARGHIERALNEADAIRQIDALLAERVEAMAICLINSFTNPVHELAIKAMVHRKAPDLPLSVSAEVLPEIKEYERTSTTVVNAYVMPIVARYLQSLRKRLNDAGIPARILLMQSNGGLTTDLAAIERPMNIIESGPAGGVVGAQALAHAKGLPKIITFDMGGTTAKASMVEDGAVSRASEYSVGAGIMIGSRLLTGAGYTLKVPAIDLAEVGAGGGSHIWIDAAGSMQIGPESAGAHPGPVCYGKGGTIPTITDANVVLGYLNPKHLVGGALKLDAALAAHLEEAFGKEHEKTYGHRAGPDEPVEPVAIQVVGEGLRARPSVPEKVRSTRKERSAAASRRAYFGRTHGWLDTPIVHRAALQSTRSGPLIIEEYDSTCVIPPGAQAGCDDAGNIVIDFSDRDFSDRDLRERGTL